MSMQLMPTDAAIIESLALKGDISGLNPTQKVQYYATLCERMGLDPTTQPFLPLRLNGKEILYASKGATDQLAKVNKVNRAIVAREKIEDVYVVTARATLPDGRAEDSIGAVPIGNLKGEALANALMKAETKAKRRVTLSICGLGMLDESELETIPDNAKAPAEPIPILPIVQEEKPKSLLPEGWETEIEQKQALKVLTERRKQIGLTPEQVSVMAARITGKTTGSKELSKAHFVELYTEIDELGKHNEVKNPVVPAFDDLDLDSDDAVNQMFPSGATQ